MKSVDIIIPVYNEEEALPGSIATLDLFLRENVRNTCTITIADNGSTDKTAAIAGELAKKYPEVRLVHLDQKGRGHALYKTLLESQADIVGYMDVDLSTDLKAFPLLIAAIEGDYDISIGSRLLPESRVVRSPKREFVSRVYNLMVRVMFFTGFHDAQCGFKAIKREVAQKLVPLVENKNWFFDTELLLLAQKGGYSIKELPVEWAEDPGTTVHVGKTAWEDIKGLLRMRFHPSRGLGKLKKSHIKGG
ncbi:MAG: glycosyltransferase family 2 protein [Dehalococcoidia bacterium]|nr:glycosyltransferase family 2 protein [Dehalococcoidia bacterium]